MRKICLRTPSFFARRTYARYLPDQPPFFMYDAKSDFTIHFLILLMYEELLPRCVKHTKIIKFIEKWQHAKMTTNAMQQVNNICFDKHLTPELLFIKSSKLVHNFNIRERKNKKFYPKNKKK